MGTAGDQVFPIASADQCGSAPGFAVSNEKAPNPVAHAMGFEADSAGQLRERGVGRAPMPAGSTTRPRITCSSNPSADGLGTRRPARASQQ